MQASMSRVNTDSQVLIYVDDILIASKTKEQCKRDTIKVLKHLQQEGHKVSKDKLQLWKTEVRYLGFTVSAEGKKLDDKRKQAILEAPKPITKKQVMAFLGMTNFCRLWIPNYSIITRPIQDLIKNSLTLSDKVEWTQTAEKAFTDIKQQLVGSQVLSLPNYSKTFIQTVDCKNGHMTSVLLQKHGSKLKPVAYYSQKLDAVTTALPVCIQAVVACSIAVQMSAHIVLYHPMILKVTHEVSILLLQSKIQFLSPARHLSCMTVLLSQPHITIERCTTINPATLLPVSTDGEPHCCLTKSEKYSKPREDLNDEPNKDYQNIYIDGSCMKDQFGKTKVAYAVVTDDKVLSANQCPKLRSAQEAELKALIEALTLSKDKKVNIYTDSQYAFSSLHTFSAQWERRGMVTSTGKPVKHANLLKQLLKAVQLPLAVNVCKCDAHTNRTDRVSKGNDFADKTAKLQIQIEPTLIFHEIK